MPEDFSAVGEGGCWQTGGAQCLVVAVQLKNINSIIRVVVYQACPVLLIVALCHYKSTQPLISTEDHG